MVCIRIVDKPLVFPVIRGKIDTYRTCPTRREHSETPILNPALGNPIIRKILIFIAAFLLWYFAAFYYLQGVASAEAPMPEPEPETCLVEAKKKYACEKVLGKWNESQWEAFDLLIRKESGWNHLAQNPSSSAFGYGQFLNSTWKLVGCSKSYDPDVQIDCAVKYVENTYGTPKAAINFHLRNNWY